LKLFLIDMSSNHFNWLETEQVLTFGRFLLSLILSDSTNFGAQARRNHPFMASRRPPAPRHRATQSTTTPGELNLEILLPTRG
jgi:hypothetical protein